MGCRLWGRTESDTAEATQQQQQQQQQCDGEGNGTLLQYSCLENPMMEETGGLQSMGSLRVGHD